MEAKKQDKFEKAKDRALRRLIAKYPDAEFEPGLFVGLPPTKYEKEYQKFYDEEFKKLEEEQKTEKKSDEKKSEEKEQLKKQLEEKHQKIDELTDTLKRLQAEFENYKKRVDREKIEFTKYAHASIIADMLPVLDSFEIALKSTSDKDKFIDGIKIVFAQFHSILEAEGLKPIKTENEKFDPYRHEVLMKEESDKPDGTILEEFQKGYMLNDKVLRFSKVKISGK